MSPEINTTSDKPTAKPNGNWRKQPRRQWNDHARKLIVERAAKLKAGGMTHEQAAVKVGIQTAQLRRWMHTFQKGLPDPPHRRSKVATGRRWDEKVKRAALAYAATHGVPAANAKFGIKAHGTIYYWRAQTNKKAGVTLPRMTGALGVRLTEARAALDKWELEKAEHLAAGGSAPEYDYHVIVALRALKGKRL